MDQTSCVCGPRPRPPCKWALIPSKCAWFWFKVTNAKITRKEITIRKDKNRHVRRIRRKHQRATLFSFDIVGSTIHAKPSFVSSFWVVLEKSTCLTVDFAFWNQHYILSVTALCILGWFFGKNYTLFNGDDGVVLNVAHCFQVQNSHWDSKITVRSLKCSTTIKCWNLKDFVVRSHVIQSWQKSWNNTYYDF